MIERIIYDLVHIFIDVLIVYLAFGKSDRLGYCVMTGIILAVIADFRHGGFYKKKEGE